MCLQKWSMTLNRIESDPVIQTNTSGPAPQDETSTDGATGPAEAQNADLEEDSDEDVQYYKEQLSMYAKRLYGPTKEWTVPV